MIRLYQAENLPLAHLLMDYLREQGINVHLFNANLQSVMGEAPVNEVAPEIWLQDEADLDQAKKVVADFEQRMQQEQGEVDCPYCGAVNPASFELCWQCGQYFPHSSHD